MVEKFLQIKKNSRFILGWIFTMFCFVATTYLKELENPLFNLQIILTSLGMFSMVVSVCLSILYVFINKE